MISNQDGNNSNHNWRSLQLFNLYRFALSISLLFISHHNESNAIFTGGNVELFIQVSIFYALFAFVTLLLSQTHKLKYAFQANVPIYIDIAFLIMIMHSCGGVISGMGLLLVFLTAAHCILYPGKYAYLTASLCTIFLLSEHAYRITSTKHDLHLSTMVGLIGLLIFFTAIFTNFLSIRVRKNQKIIAKQADLLANSMQMNTHIVAFMQQGVVLLDNLNQIRTINNAAMRILGIAHNTSPKTVADLPQAVQHCIFAWQNNMQNISPIQIKKSLPEIRLHFQNIGQDNEKSTAIFLYDLVEEHRKAQDLKLSSLGHLTANIAHELRNPLGAASHAAQLLKESAELSPQSLQLASMILNHCDRMNQVIKNVLSLSGQKNNSQVIDLNQWLAEHVGKLNFQDFTDAKIELQLCDGPIKISADASQLLQIIINLCENGLRHNVKKQGIARVVLRTQRVQEPPAVVLDVIDEGDGVPEDIREYIFEPFYTTEKTGTGLGLFLTRELCQINNAQIQYFHKQTHSQFRITFVGEPCQ